MRRVVIDTNVILGSMLSREGGPNRRFLRACLQGRFTPLVGQALFNEYVMGRKELFRSCPLSVEERTDLLDAILSVSEWVKIYYGWRPNLPDEGDNHLFELAVAGTADAIVTHNLRDLGRAELRFPEIRVLNPATLLEEML